MPYFKVFCIFFIVPWSVYAQNHVTIEDCIHAATINHSLYKQSSIIHQIGTYEYKNISKTYLPHLRLVAEASYQSDVTELYISNPNLPFDIQTPTLSKDHYSAYLEASQLLWNGGISSAQKKIIEKKSAMEKIQIEIQLYDVQKEVMQLYFNILATDAYISLLRIAEDNLAQNRITVQSQLHNGIAMESDLYLIDVELLEIDKKKIEHIALKNSYIHALESYTQFDLISNATFVIPTVDFIPTHSINRAELNYFDAKSTLYTLQKKERQAMNNPSIHLFLNAGYGRPALNFLDDNFNLYGIVGLRFSWNLWNMYTQHNAMQILDLKQQSARLYKDDFIFKTTVALSKEKAEIYAVQERIAKEQEIVALRTKIREQSESRYKHGVYKTNELIRDIHAEHEAMQQQEFLLLQYAMKVYVYNFMQNQHSTENTKP